MRYTSVLLFALAQTALSAPLGTGFRPEAICQNIGDDSSSSGYVVPVQRLQGHYMALGFRPLTDGSMPLSKVDAHFRMPDNGKDALNDQDPMIKMMMSSASLSASASAPVPSASASLAVAGQRFIGMEDTGDMKMMVRPITASPKAASTPRLQHLKYNAGC